MKFLKGFQKLRLGYIPKKERTADGIDPQVVAFADGYSQIAEQYRAIASKLSMVEDVKTILITSSLPQEGKTTTACNLAATLANTLQKKTLIIDADLRRPKIHTLLGCEKGLGLTDVIEQRCSIQEALSSSKVRQLNVLSSGTSCLSPDLLLNSENAKKIFSELKDLFDYIIIDTPPILKASDVHALGVSSDFNIFVVKAQVTPEHIVKEAIKTLKDTPAEANCCLMTNVEKVPDYYSYFANENYRDYYSPLNNYVLEETNDSNNMAI